MTNHQAAGGGGTIRLGDLLLYVEPLPIRLELTLFEELRKLAKEQSGDFLRPVEPLLDRLEKLGTPIARARAAAILETAARMEARQELPGEEAAETARRTPRGVCLELWYRARRADPKLDIRALEAVIVDPGYAQEIHWQIKECLGVKDAKDQKS